MTGGLRLAADGAGPEEAPRYRQILATLRQRMQSGAYPLGGTLPTETELCDEFGASRYTVREALRRLVEQGMVSRRQKSGTVVVASEPQNGYVQSFRTLADLFQFALDTHYEVLRLGMVTIDAPTALLIGGEAGSRWLKVDGVRRTRPGGDMVCFTTSYIPERLAWVEPELYTCVGPFYALLEKRASEKIIEATQEIQAEAMPAATSTALGYPPHSIALRLFRRYASRYGTMIASLNWHPAETFTYRMQLHRPSDH